jgi:RHS repeat-associated protein
VANASSSQGADVPAHVLDGSASTRWTTGGNQTPGQWFTVDFGSQKTFTQVTLDVASNTNDFARSYELYVSNDGQTWGSPVATGTGATGVITIVFPAQTARFIGIVQTGSSSSNWWSIAELNVYTGTVPMVPLVPSGWTATASVSGSSDQPSKAIDGNATTRFSTDAVQVNGQTFQLDMGAPKLLAGLKMDSASFSTDYARGYQVFASNSTSSWGVAIASGTATASPITVLFPQTTARYVKIVQTGSASNWWSIAELTTYTVGSFTPTAAVLGRNGWTATASSSASGSGPSNALDDNGSTLWSTSVNQANGQTYTLDMLAPRTFTMLTLDAGAANASDYPRGYQVFVSGDGTNWGTAVATGAGSGQVTTISFPAQAGRYVKIVETGTSTTNKWSIAELNVYGTPPAVMLRGGWTASASPNNADAALGIDGKVETQWSTKTAQVNGQSYTVDMKAAQSFNEIVLDVECNPADYPRGVQVFVSNNGTTWGSAIASATGTSAMVTVAFPAQSARYLKVVQTASGSNYWGLAELNVLNTNPAACSTACVALDACHDVGTCDPSTGVCSKPTKADGTSCSDGNVCNGAETCNAGLCQSGTPLQVDDSNPCTVDSCDAVAGVQHVPGNAGTLCRASTGGCDVAETCTGSSAACPADAFKPNGTSCDDGKSCTTGDVCTSGVCGGTVSCAAKDDCHTDGACNTLGACTDPVKSDGTMCDDGNPCTSGEACQTGACTGGTQTCGSNFVATETGSMSGSTTLTLSGGTADKTAVVPGDTVAFTATITNTGIDVSVAGQLNVTNTGASALTVQGFTDVIEYFSPTSNSWVPLAGVAYDGAGNALPPPAPLTAQFYTYDPTLFVAKPVGGTVVAAGATSSWSYFSQIAIPPAAVSLLFDPSQSTGLRNRVEFASLSGSGPPAGSATASLDIGQLVPNVPTEEMEVGAFYRDLSVAFLKPAAPLIPPGGSVVFSGSRPVPVIPAKGAAESDGVYLARLQSAAFPPPAVANQFAWVEFDVSEGESMVVPFAIQQLVPIVSAEKSGPASSQAGSTLSYAVALANNGTEVASPISIADSIDGGPGFPVPAPSQLGASGTASVAIDYPTDPARPAGLISDVVTVSWLDPNGNVYGPIHSSASTSLSGGFPNGQLSMSTDPGLPTPLGTTKTFTVTAIAPNNAPAASLAVKVIVTGANPQTLSGVTGADGTVQLSYVGAATGTDQVYATATVASTPLQTPTTQAFWAKVVGAPCQGATTPLDVMLALDVSPSMLDEGKIQAVNAASASFIDDLNLGVDKAGSVLFMGTITEFQGLSTSASSLKANIAAGVQGAIDACGGFCAGGTNIPAALDAAIDELTGPHHHPGSNQLVILVSDGGNTGADPAPQIARLRALGVRAVTIGVGENIDFQLLQKIASAPSDYFYAPSAPDLAWVYSAMSGDVCRNQPPLVRAGGNQGAYAVELPNALQLQGEVHDDGPPGNPMLTSEWSVVSGPGTVTFGDATSPVTTALFSDPGTYVLALEATDGLYTMSDKATITVDSEPSLTGASFVASLGTPGSLAVGSAASLLTKLTDAGGHGIANFPVQVTIAGPNAQTATILTDASGNATFGYSGVNVGTDVLTAVALGLTPLSAAPVSVAWTAATTEQVVTQGWIGAPLHQSTVTGSVGITVGQGITLTSGTVTYWPLSAPDQIHTLASGVAGGPGAVVATLDTTVLANGPWVVKLDGTDNAGHSQISEASVTVSGDYKPGRVVVEETDMTIPLPGLPLTVGRRYDSLEKDNVGDFGNGWSLALGHPRLEVDPAHNVTITMPDNRRVTFYFQATSASASITFAWLYSPGYVPEAGTFGTLTADGCSLMVLSAGQLVCFLDSGLEYAPTTYTYTDPYGRVFTMGASGELKSIVDQQQNALTFTPGGIVSSSGQGVSVTFARDAQGRITSVTGPRVDPQNDRQIVSYTYGAGGDLTTVKLTDNSTEGFTYDHHRLLTSTDPNGKLARTSTYDTTGHLLTDTDALGNVTSYAYDLAAHKTTITNPDQGTVQQTFDDRGLLLKEVDPLGRTTQHTYDANRNELTRTNAVGEVTTMTYDANGNQTSIKNDRGETTHVTYNAFSQPLTSTDPTGHKTTIDYDSLGIPTKFSDEVGTLATFTSSAHGLPLTVTDAAGKAAYMTYDSFGNESSRTDRLGRTTSKTYDGVGRVIGTTDPRGTGTSYSYLLRGPKSLMTDVGGVFAQNRFGYVYDENLNLTSETSDLGRFTSYTYDALNHVTKVTHADNTTTQYTRDFRGNALTMKDESGRTTTYAYDKAGQLAKTTFPDGAFTTRAYDGLGRLTTATDERGNATTYEYEAGCGCAERTTKVTDPLGRSTVTTYDAVGRRASVTDAAGHTTSYAYDARGHLTTTSYADNTSETDAYDSVGRRTSHTDQMGSVTQYGYDAEGQLTSVTDALSHATQYGYDASGNLTSVTDANGHTTTYVYDHLNRKSQRTLPLGMSETWTYNMYGDNLTHVDFRGKTTTMTYDALARLLTKVPDPTLGEPTVTFTFNPTGTRAKMVDASGSTTYTYDTRDRLLSKATPAGTLTYTYDLAGNVASIQSSNANGTSVNYAWDAANQLASVTDNRAGGVTTSAYTATGRPSTVAVPNGVSAIYSYDTRDRVTSLAWAHGTAPAFGSWTYDFNNRGQRTSVTDATGRHVAYGYDAIARLTSETITNNPQGAAGNGELDYALDPTGNRLTRTSTLAALGAQVFTYNGNDELTTDGYDANRSTTSSDGHTYTYDFENRLVSKDSVVVTIVYDGDGDRVAKTVGGVTTKYVVDDLNPTGYQQVLEEVSGGAVQTEYTYGTMLVSQMRSPSAGAQTSYYGYDAHGDITFLTDATGNVTDTYDYDAWGNVVASTGTTPNSRLYTGEELDPDLGFVNLRARQYKASTGRFLTIDPLDPAVAARGRMPSVDRSGSPFVNAILDVQSLDDSEPRVHTRRYLFASGDPVSRLDPTGTTDATADAFFDFAFSRPLIVPVLFVGSAAVVAGGFAALASKLKERLCESHYQMDLATCRELPDPAARSRCYESALARKNACLKGQPLPPLQGWPGW